MVVESLVNPKVGLDHPWTLFFIGCIYSLIAGVIAHVMFAPAAGLAMVFLTALAAAPFMFSLIKREEGRQPLFGVSVSLFDEYRTVITSLLVLFIGITCGFVTLIAISPTNMSESLFTSQQDSLSLITGRITEQGALGVILANNFQVLTMALLFSFLYGFGAITLIVWNSSIVAVALWDFIIMNNHVTTPLAVVWGVARYALHGIPEIGAYLLAGVAGGIISIAMIRHGIGTKRWWSTLRDAGKLSLLSVFLLIIAGLIEVFISPLLY